ncbi:MAG: DUF1318 domain-containing protein [Gallionella sp.]|nr:MAG: DUF1318 domain-containing protein [Gallionella sp.]
MKKTWSGLLLAAFTLSACATANIGFPANAAGKAADKTIGGIWQTPEAGIGSANKPAAPEAGAIAAAPDAFAVADFGVNTPGVGAIRQKMQARHTQLSGHYASGAVGLTSDGMIGLHDAGVVPPASRYTVDALVAAENQDRNALYAEIAKANGHPEWEDEIRNTFAQRWIERARPGWWMQGGDDWEQK